MHSNLSIDRVVDLTDPAKNAIYNMSVEEAKKRLISENSEAVREIDGQFALLATSGKNVYLTRSIGRPLRYFIAKKADGPCLVAADRIDRIRQFLQNEGLTDQFHPSYTRMAPAHYVTEVQLVGCPDPNPSYRRYFTPQRNTLPVDSNRDWSNLHASFVQRNGQVVAELRR